MKKTVINLLIAALMIVVALVFLSACIDHEESRPDHSTEYVRTVNGDQMLKVINEEELPYKKGDTVIIQQLNTFAWKIPNEVTYKKDTAYTFMVGDSTTAFVETKLAVIQ
jgi:uncharacterized lipoprotein YehR (DUF1307 family)